MKYLESLSQFQIASIILQYVKENVFEQITKPSKIIVTSSQSTMPNTKWIGKKF